MKERSHIYVSRKNVLTWMTVLCLLGSAVARIAVFGLKGSEYSVPMWSQILLPVAACLLYVLIILLDGKERFYKTAIPVWMMSLYFCCMITHVGFSKMVIVLYWIAFLFLSVLYTQITSGIIRQHWLLFFLFCVPLGALLYLNRQILTAFSWKETLPVLPDLLMAVGLILLVFAIRLHPADEYHPTWGDRTDGRRVRTLPPMQQMTSYIMVERNAATNQFTDSLEISNLERYVRQKRKEGYTGFGLNHVLLACYVRALAKYPGLNRFVAGQKVYSRGDDIQYCMVIKKEMRADSPDTAIKVHLSPRDTALDVYRKLNDAVTEVKNTPLNSSFDHTAHALIMLPGVLLKFTMWVLKTLDYFGLLPSFLLEVSPFHGSVFFTSMGSLGIPAIYHHLYDFGNLPVFGSFSCKRHATELMADGSIVQRKYIDIKFTMDERIADGYYYAAFFKQLKRIIRHPEVLDDPPEEVVQDID